MLACKRNISDSSQGDADTAALPNSENLYFKNVGILPQMEEKIFSISYSIEKLDVCLFG